MDIRTYDEASPGDGSEPGDEPDAQVKADPADLFKRISIDDSIEFESEKNYRGGGRGNHARHGRGPRERRDRGGLRRSLT